MTDEELLYMCREHGASTGKKNGIGDTVIQFTIAELREFIEDAIAHEREACAKVCEEFGNATSAAAIRARS